jgi:uncharacterized membrane protein YraQ (UPF0718 family)
MNWITLVVTVLTVIVAPFIGWLIKYLADKKAKSEEAATLAAQEQKAAKENDTTQSASAGTVNQSIDAQKTAREQWTKEHPHG